MVEAFRSILSDLLVKKHCKVQPDLLLEFAKYATLPRSPAVSLSHASCSRDSDGLRGRARTQALPVAGVAARGNGPQYAGRWPAASVPADHRRQALHRLDRASDPRTAPFCLAR